MQIQASPLPNRFGPARKCNNDKLFCRRARLAASGIIRHNNPLSDPIAFVSRYGAAEGRVAAVYLRGERLRGSTQAIVTNCRRTCWIGDKERQVCTLPPQNFGRTDSWKERRRDWYLDASETQGTGRVRQRRAHRRRNSFHFHNMQSNVRIPEVST